MTRSGVVRGAVPQPSGDSMSQAQGRWISSHHKGSSMSDTPPPPPRSTPGPPPPQDPRCAKAHASAEKAYAKASCPWYRKKRFIIPLALVGLAIVAAALSSGGDMDVAGSGADDTAQQDTGGSGDDGEATITGIGSLARDGKFEFTVSGIECGAATVGDDVFSEEAQGHFCLLDVRVENIGDEAASFFADNQYLLGDEGTQYSASLEATFANNTGGDEVFTEINPGNAIEGTVVFDVPTSAAITRAELHDSAFSGGVVVTLE
jgi:hypothetical protein